MNKTALIILLILLIGATSTYIFKKINEQNFQAEYIPQEVLIEKNTVPPLTEEETAELIKKQIARDPKILDTSITTYQNYTDKETGISFKYPSHYTFEQRPSYSIWGENSSSTIFSNPKGPYEMSPSIHLTIFPKKLEDQYLETLQKYVTETYADFIQTGIESGIRGEEDSLISSQFMVFENTWIELITKTYYVDVDYGNSYYYFYQKGDTIYQLRFFGLEKEVINEIMDSVRFIKFIDLLNS